ncbi:hypothetical protein JCM10207_004789 [Rhodosporidiobolus poonsookiae]
MPDLLKALSSLASLKTLRLSAVDGVDSAVTRHTDITLVDFLEALPPSLKVASVNAFVFSLSSQAKGIVLSSNEVFPSPQVTVRVVAPDFPEPNEILTMRFTRRPFKAQAEPPAEMEWLFFVEAPDESDSEGDGSDAGLDSGAGTASLVEL